jgi:hypothetical protein
LPWTFCCAHGTCNSLSILINKISSDVVGDDEEFRGMVNRTGYWLSIEERRRDGKQHLGICWE